MNENKRVRKKNFKFKENKNLIQCYILIKDRVNKQISRNKIMDEVREMFILKPDTITIRKWVVNAELKLRNKDYPVIMERWRQEYTEEKTIQSKEQNELEEMFSEARCGGYIK